MAAKKPDWTVKNGIFWRKFGIQRESPGNWILRLTDFLLLVSFNQTSSRAPEQILGMLDNIQTRGQLRGEMLVAALFAAGTTLRASWTQDTLTSFPGLQVLRDKPWELD